MPDFQNAEFNTSSLLVTDKVNMLTAPVGADETRERPFVFGAQELIPADDMDFAKGEELSIFTRSTMRVSTRPASRTS